MTGDPVLESWQRRGGILGLSERQGFKPWKTLPNDLVVHRMISPNHGRRTVHYRAFAGGLLFADWGACDFAGGPPPNGHIEGDYSRVQGAKADARELDDWLRIVGGLTVVAPGQEQLVA